MTLQQVTDIALSLPIDLRMDLLDKLNASINPVSPEIEQAWAEEAQRRMAAYLAGEVSAIDGKLAFESIFKRYSGMNFRLDPQAAIELEIAIDYYDSISPRLGHAFAKSVYAAIQQAIEFPEAWTHIHQDTRRVVAKNFPTALFYQKDENSIIVLAIMNQHQKPNYWQDRLQ